MENSSCYLCSCVYVHLGNNTRNEIFGDLAVVFWQSSNGTVRFGGKNKKLTRGYNIFTIQYTVCVCFFRLRNVYITLNVNIKNLYTIEHPKNL